MPRNAWTKLKRRQRITINESARFPVETKRGPAILVQYDRPSSNAGKPWRHYQQFIYPDGSEEWRYNIATKYLVTEEMLERYWQNWNGGHIQKYAKEHDWSEQSKVWSVKPRKNPRDGKKATSPTDRQRPS